MEESEAADAAPEGDDQARDDQPAPGKDTGKGGAEPREDEQQAGEGRRATQAP